MAYRPKILNSSKFSPNPWVPSKKLFYKPVRTGFANSGMDSASFNNNICRLCLIFPSMKVHFIQKVYKLLNFNVLQSIDTLLFIRNMGRSRLQKQMSIRKNTCARCCPTAKESLFQRIIEEEERYGDRIIIPNITFSDNSCEVHYENNLNLTPPTVPVYNEVNPVDDAFNNEDKIDVTCTDANVPEINSSYILNSSKNRLRSPRPPPGFYGSKLVEENINVIGHDANKPEISPSTIRLLIQRHASGYYSSKLTGEQNVETLRNDANLSQKNLFDIGQNSAQNNHLI